MSDNHQDLDRLVLAINRLSLAIEGSAGSSQEREWEVISPRAGPVAPSATTLQERQDRVSFGDYNAFAELLPECPDRWLGLCSRLKGGSHSADYRARRA